ncbi:MAG: Mut7-C RNAse domain-containing protein [Candidatus Alcyoniella australis]|nr:Mut7-C RNAse domain-containing protein [Candidatus Alcyoniella australis]
MRPDPLERFALDGHLGALARLLRTLGYDAAWRHPIDDCELIELAYAENRMLLTRDTRLVQRRGLGPHLLIEHNEPERQLVSLVRCLGLRPDPQRWFSRCLRCNLALECIGRETAAPCVPPYVLQTQDQFTRCPGCRRVYWPGSHGQRMRRRLRELLSEAENDAQG